MVCERGTNRREAFGGAMTHGTSMIGEIMPYLQALDWIAEYEEKRRTRPVPRRRGGPRVHILTDSAACVSRGNRPGVEAESHPVLWQALDGFRHRGMEITWHHIPRRSVGCNIYTDHYGRALRILLDTYRPAGPTFHGQDKESFRDVHAWNP